MSVPIVHVMRDGVIRLLRRVTFLHITFASAVVALLVQVTVRDAVPGLAVLFYAAPLPVIVVLFGAAAVVAWRKKRRFARRASVVLAGACLILWFASSYHRAPARTAHSTSAGTRTVMFWNLARGGVPEGELLKAVRANQADIVALVETRRRGARRAIYKGTGLAGFEFRHLRGDMALGVRGKIIVTAYDEIPQRLRYNRVRVVAGGTTYTLIIADVRANAFLPRRQAFERLRVAVEQHRDDKVILVGDFNTPVDSIYFRPLRAMLFNAFETAGHGLIETWPAPLPLLSLDQVWLGGGLRVLACRYLHSWRSDHMAVVAEVGE